MVQRLWPPPPIDTNRKYPWLLRNVANSELIEHPFYGRSGRANAG